MHIGEQWRLKFSLKIARNMRTRALFHYHGEKSATFFFLLGAFRIFFFSLITSLLVSPTLITLSATKDKLFCAHEKLMRNQECCPVVVSVFSMFQSLHRNTRREAVLLSILFVLIGIIFKENLCIHLHTFWVWVRSYTQQKQETALRLSVCKQWMKS